MRAVLLLVVAVGCGSEHDLNFGLRPGAAGDDPDGSTLTLPGEPPAPDRSALEGTVCAPDGESEVAAATVRVLHDGGPSETTTDGAGWFSLTGLPPGQWEVEIAKGSFPTVLDVTLEPGKVTTLTVDECLPLEQGETEIAVVTGAYDDIGALLDQLGLGYDTINGLNGDAYVDFLRSPAELAKYDIIFFNCGMGNGWIPHADEVGDNLRDFVRNGGSVYSSDWAYWLVEVGWPADHDFLGEERDATQALIGAAGPVSAEVLDPAMAEVLGSANAALNYDLDGWAAMEGARADVLIEGRYSWWDRFTIKERSGPLATRLRDGEGQVLYTSFHNERQSTADMLLLLQEIVLSL